MVAVGAIGGLAGGFAAARIVRATSPTTAFTGGSRRCGGRASQARAYHISTACGRWPCRRQLRLRRLECRKRDPAPDPHAGTAGPCHQHRAHHHDDRLPRGSTARRPDPGQFGSAHPSCSECPYGSEERWSAIQPCVHMTDHHSCYRCHDDVCSPPRRSPRRGSRRSAAARGTTAAEPGPVSSWVGE
jgi:hypothetical protein